MAQIECLDVTLGYDGNVLIEDLSFSVSEGDYLCIVGENGAGKSTLVKTLLGQTKPLKGEILSEVSLKEIGYLPQQAELQKDFPATVNEIVMSGAFRSIRGRFWLSSDEKKKAKENMKKLDIDSFSKESYKKLSGGQQQRVLLARALCAAKKLVLLDEPAKGLDPVKTNEMYHLIMDLNKSENITVIMVSHDIHAAVRHAKHILHLGNKEVFFGTCDEYKESLIGKSFLHSDKCRRCEE